MCAALGHVLGVEGINHAAVVVNQAGDAQHVPVFPVFVHVVKRGFFVKAG
jgi:hypothetical protein